jgi:hypothetical protein
MADVPFGFSFDQAGDGFVLRNKTADGAVTEIKMTAEQTQGLKTQIDLWQQQRSSTVLARTYGQVLELRTHEITRVVVEPSNLGEIVLMMFAPDNSQVHLVMRWLVGHSLAVQLVDLLGKLKGAAVPTRQ